MRKPEYGNLYWRIASGCNLKCFMCFRDHAGRPVKGYEQNLLEGAKNLGFKTVIITGGEPTLRPDLKKLVHTAKSYGLHVRLETNGVLLDKKKLRSMKKNLDSIAFPLHGSYAKLHDSIVGMKGHFQVIGEKARIANELAIPIKITTAVSRKNIGDIENIAKLLSNGILPQVYNLIRIVKRNVDPGAFSENMVEEEEFLVMKEKLMQGNYPLRLSFCSGDEEIDRAYIFVNPDFTVTMTDAGAEKKIGDLKTEPLELIIRKAGIDHELHLKRSEATFI